MSKKSGSLVKIVAFVAGVAAVGTACYVYKDKIKEFFEKNDVKGKINDAKDFVSEKVFKNKDNDDFFDDAEFFDEDDSADEDSANRGYTSITISSEDSPSEPESPAMTKPQTATVTEDTSSAKTVSEADDEQKETLSAEKAAPVEDSAPEEYEYEGLSDVSEDEDVLADEAALDGADF